MGITSATQTHMHLSRAALTLFGGITAAEHDEFIDVKESLREISLQAAENNKYRGDLLQEDVMRDLYQPQPAAEKCVDILPDDLWISMRQQGLDLDDFADRLQY